jgi:hypothetical protein
MPRARIIRYVVLVLCLFVLLFAAAVKLSQYDGSAPNHPNPVTASKLWLNGQKMELHAADSLAPIYGLAFLIFTPLVLTSRNLHLTVRTAPVARHQRLFEVHRFLRPPPSF